MRAARAATLLLVLPATASAQRAGDTVFIVPGGHLDLGFTAPIGAIGPQRIQILDRAIEFATRDPSFVFQAGYATGATTAEFISSIWPTITALRNWLSRPAARCTSE